MLAIKTPDLVKDIQDLEGWFDFSNYPDTHPLYNRDNENRLFKVKVILFSLWLLFLGTPSFEEGEKEKKRLTHCFLLAG